MPPSDAAASKIMTRAITTSSLLGFLLGCVYFRSYAVLYLLFTLPGTVEFIVMARVSSKTPVGALSILCAYLYNIALATSIVHVITQGLAQFPNAQAEHIFQQALRNYTGVYLASQLPLFLYHYYCTHTGANGQFHRAMHRTGQQVGAESVHPQGLPSTQSLCLVAVGALWSPGFTFGAALLAAHTSIEFVAFVIIVTGFQDCWQLLFGKLFGQHRPFPYLSPKKSVEGYVGGTVMTVLTIWYMARYFAYPWIPFSLVVVVLGTVGDLSMSFVKRSLALKDTGDLLPGIGGLLDRMDSQLLILPATYVLACWMGVAWFTDSGFYYGVGVVDQ